MPRTGQIAIFDRSWYGRVLVERVEGFASQAEWRRAYGEINDFEEELTAGGHRRGQVLAGDQQGRAAAPLRGARGTRSTSGSRSPTEDWRNREKWDQYHDAIGDMIDRTSTPYAPWTLVEAQDKHWARVKVLETLCDRLEKEL